MKLTEELVQDFIEDSQRSSSARIGFNIFRLREIEFDRWSITANGGVLYEVDMPIG